MVDGILSIEKTTANQLNKCKDYIKSVYFYIRISGGGSYDEEGNGVKIG